MYLYLFRIAGVYGFVNGNSEKQNEYADVLFDKFRTQKKYSANAIDKFSGTVPIDGGCVSESPPAKRHAMTSSSSLSKFVTPATMPPRR